VPTPKPNLVRAIGRWSLVTVMVNFTIGAGIFALPSAAAGILGSSKSGCLLDCGRGNRSNCCLCRRSCLPLSSSRRPVSHRRHPKRLTIRLRVFWEDVLARLETEDRATPENPDGHGLEVAGFLTIFVSAIPIHRRRKYLRQRTLPGCGEVRNCSVRCRYYS
jgi:hypothetical protein